MGAPYDRMGFERQLLMGNPGATATVLLTNVIDIKHDIAVDKADTTVRGDGTSVPIKTDKPIARNPKITWGMRDQPNDAQLALLRAAAKAARPVALVIKEYNSGGTLAVIFDGDCNIGVSEDHGLGGGGMFNFDCTMSRDYGRLPVF